MGREWYEQGGTPILQSASTGAAPTAGGIFVGSTDPARVTQVSGVTVSTGGVLTAAGLTSTGAVSAISVTSTGQVRGGSLLSTGAVTLTGIPSTDPQVTGRLWVSSGVLVISAT